MNTIERGNAAEGRVIGSLSAMGARLLIPFGEGHPYDVAIDGGGSRLVRVQCKSARRRGDVLAFNGRSTDHGRGRVSYQGRADLFGVFSPHADGVYFIPVEECDIFEVSLRLKPTLNNQRRRVRFAADYHEDRWTLERIVAAGAGLGHSLGLPGAA